jgi:multiple sugar transport system permease protein
VARRRGRRRSGRWLRFALLLVLTALLIVPVLVPVWRILVPEPGSAAPGGPAAALAAVAGTLADDAVITWIANSLIVTTLTVVLSVAVAAPAGYVLARGRGRGVQALALVIFTLQAVPLVLFLIPLFIVFAGLGLVDSLSGLTVIYIGLSVAVATWTMSSYLDSVPIELEEAAWLDGCSVFGGFVRVVLRNALPGVLSTAVFTFLLTWNDYWIAVVFIHTETKYTLGLALAGPGGFPALAVIAMLPPLIVFAVLNRFFSLGGIGGALAGR